MPEAPETLWAADAEGTQFHECRQFEVYDKPTGAGIPYRRADTVVDRDVAAKMAAALERCQDDLPPHSSCQRALDDALAAHQEATSDG